MWLNVVFVLLILETILFVVNWIEFVENRGKEK